MRICLVSDAYYPYYSGVTEYVYELSRHLKKMGHYVDIITGSYGLGDEDYKAIRIGKVIKIKALGSYSTLPFGFNIPSLMKDILNKKGYDIVHLNGPFFPNLSFFAMKYSNVPIVATFHTASENKFHIFSGIYKHIFKEYYKKINVKIAVSRHAMDTYKQFIENDFEIIPNGVDVERFKPEGEKVEWMKDLNTILFVGRLDKRKGLDRLLKAFLIVLKEVDARIVVVGKGPLFPKYASFVRRNKIEDKVHFVGKVSPNDLPKYYRSATIYTSPATGNESFGIVLLEAMASGCPVIASNIKGYNEVIKDGENGILVDTKDSKIYAEKITRLLREKDLRETLQKGALKEINEKYRWNKVVLQINEIYNKIA